MAQYLLMTLFEQGSAAMVDDGVCLPADSLPFSRQRDHQLGVIVGNII